MRYYLLFFIFILFVLSGCSHIRALADCIISCPLPAPEAQVQPVSPAA